MAVVIHSGQLTKPVVFKQPVKTQDSGGGKEFAYPVETLSTRASVRTIDVFRASAINNLSLIDSVEVYIRYRGTATTINEEWLMVIDGKDYVIHSVQMVDDRKRFIRIIAKHG